MKIAEHVHQILIEKGLDAPYISEKMNLFKGVTDELEALIKARFLDEEGRAMLAERTVFSKRDLDGFFEVARTYRP